MKNEYISMIVWMVISAAISFVLIRIFGFWIGLALTFGIFMLINIYIRRMIQRRGFGSIGGISYRCIACGYKFKGGECPRCGSKMKRAEF